MKENWEIVPFGNVCEISGGSQPPKSNFIYEPKEGYIRLIQVRDFRTDKYITYIPKEKAKKFCEASDIMIGRYGPPIFGIFSGLEGAYNVALMKAIPNEEILNKEYFRWFLRNDALIKFVEKTSKRAAGQDGVRKERLYQYPVPIPPLLEQKAIVKILDEAFAKIDQSKANIEKNIENAKELFTNWSFLQIKNSKWSKNNWEDICDFIRGPFGGSLKKSMFVESGYAVYEQKQAIHNDYDALRYYIDSDKFEEMKRFEVKAADLLMSCSGVTLGRISEVPQNAPAGIINQALLKLTSNPSKILNDFLVLWIRSKVFQDLIFNVSGGAAQPNVPAVKILKKIQVPCPKINEQKEFIELHNKMKVLTQGLINKNIVKSKSLDELKKSLLQKAFSGELTKSETIA